MSENELKDKNVPEDREYPIGTEEDISISIDIDDSDDEDINEAEIPIHIRRKDKKRKGTEKKKRKKKKSRKKKEHINIIALMRADGTKGSIRAISIGGKTIKFWPLYVFAILIFLIVTLVMTNGSINVLHQDISVVGLADDLEGYRILVLSDMNGKRFGDEQSLLMRSIDGEKYDIIVCVGDMVGESGDAEPFYEFLDSLSRPSKVYFICGDADPGPYVSTPRAISGTLREIVLEDWILGAIERGANYVDSPTKITVGEKTIWLTPASYLNTEAMKFRADWKDQMEQEEDGVVTGLESDFNTLPITSYRYLLAKKFFTAANAIKSTDLVIGLSHIVPDDDFIISAATHDGDEGVYLPEPELLICGHYCGGVWKIPALGAFYIPNRMLPRYGWLPAQEDVNGLSRIGETQVYISGGLSTTSAVKLLPFRLFNNPEMTVLKLTASLPESMLD